MDDPEIKECVDRWQNSKTEHKDNKDELIALLTLKVKMQQYNLTELAEIVGIKRTTLYYMMFGKEGKNGQNSAA